MDETIKIKKSYLVFAVAFIIIIILVILLSLNKLDVKVIGIETESLTLEEKFAVLSEANSNVCAGSQYLDLTEGSIQGSCCSAMDFHRYKEQVEGLKKYADIEQIPKDPYDIEVSMVKQLLDYQQNIELTAEQQVVYDEAMKMSDEGGPCCCKCWRWTAFEGLAKYLISEHNFTAEQIAEVWDLADGCGGSGHEHGETHDAMMNS